MFRKNSHKGFTIIELLLGMTIIGVLAGITIVAVNPLRQLLMVQNIGRAYRAQQIEKAFFQYLIDNNDYPGDRNIPEGEVNAKNICRYGKTDSGCINIDELIPRYVACMPYDEAETNADYSGYGIYLSSGRGNVYSIHEESGVNAGGGCEPFPKPIAWWKLDESSNITIATEVTGVHNGVYTSAPNANNDIPSVEFSFDNSKSHEFTSGGHVAIPSFEFPENTFAITAWVKWDGGGVNSPRIIAKENINGSVADWILAIDKSNGKLIFTLDTGSATTYSAGSLDTNKWNHVAATYNESRMCLFQDGEKLGCQAKTGTIRTGSESVWIGSSPSNNSSEPFSGLLDDIRIYTEPLSEGQIEVIATGGT